jgi:hypothetical protein
MALTNEQKLASDEKVQFYGNQYWRLNNLYKIRDKDGNIVTFRMTEPQRSLYEEHWYLNVILKARQLGFTTFIDLLILDTCLFNPNVKAGIIAHHQDDARAIFEEKIKFPYESMDQSIAGYISATTDRAGEIVFSNGQVSGEG